ncbi:MAG: carotenoid 1,2-hydratase [Betaproteobacteria bacterium]|nr:MAG: carotenoid 1,2-hydratase [Betaproteobacteria bacterium]
MSARRELVAAGMALMLCCSGKMMPAGDAADSSDTQANVYPVVEAGRKLVFPRDHGAHPDYRTEWWYITGWIESDGVERGFQVTFFRSRPGLQEDNESAFAPKQLIFAHAAIADAANGQLIYDERVGRQGFGLAYANSGNTDVGIDGWTLSRSDGEYRARIAADQFAFDLSFLPTQPVLLQGRGGFSSKGPRPGEASYYYSLPHLRVEGSALIYGETTAVSGNAWLDHEWSSEYLSPAAQGWDWVSINFSDGGALMAFRMRARSGGTLWAGGSVRHHDGTLSTLSPGDVEFEPTRLWRSPRTDIEYPVAMRVRAGHYDLKVTPLMDDQELDARASTGIIYWEGAVRASVDNQPVGRGYLELTGYGDRPGM